MAPILPASTGGAQAPHARGAHGLCHHVKYRTVADAVIKAGNAVCTEGIVSQNGGILLVILFPRDTAAVTAWASLDFWAFNEGMHEA